MWPRKVKSIPPVKAVMTPFPRSIEVSEPTTKARKMMTGFGFHHLPVMDQGELVGVICEPDLRRAENPPTMNTAFFPHAQLAEYWSGNDYSFQYNTAWAWSFEYGHDRVDWKKQPKFVRLVRGTAGELEEVKE